MIWIGVITLVLLVTFVSEGSFFVLLRWLVGLLLIFSSFISIFTFLFCCLVDLDYTKKVEGSLGQTGMLSTVFFLGVDANSCEFLSGDVAYDSVSTFTFKRAVTERCC